MPPNSVLWLLLIPAALLGFFLIQQKNAPTARNSGIALIAVITAALAYVTYQITTNFRQNDLTAIAILILIPSGILCIKKARSPQTRNLGISLLHLAALLTIYLTYIIILAILHNPT